MSARPAPVSDGARPWLDKDGDGEITTEELNKIPLFRRAPMKTQGLLRDFHRIHGKNSILFVISKFDFVYVCTPLSLLRYIHGSAVCGPDGPPHTHTLFHLLHLFLSRAAATTIMYGRVRVPTAVLR